MDLDSDTTHRHGVKDVRKKDLGHLDGSIRTSLKLNECPLQPSATISGVQI